MGLEWVADNIAFFGGDPSQVTIAGESAGAMLDQMVLYSGDNTYKGSPLFRGAIMSSGSMIPAEPVDSARAQAVYDSVVETAGCTDASPSTLECLRGLDYIDFLNAVSTPPGLLSYSGVAVSYLPRPDGVILPDSPDALVSAGKYTPIPFIIGDQQDEGTLFSLFQSNVTTTDRLVDYLHKFLFHLATPTQIRELVNSYGSGLVAIAEGSPFGTGLFNEIFPGFKRRAALLGDFIFTLSRRAFLETATTLHPDVPAWSYLATYDSGTPVLGTFHGSDLLQVFYGIVDDYAAHSLRTYFANFVHALDPNGDENYPEWPRWAEARELVEIKRDSVGKVTDNFRSASYEVLKRLRGVLRV